jgi:signal transduction histidine kinase
VVAALTSGVSRDGLLADAGVSGLGGYPPLQRRQVANLATAQQLMGCVEMPLPRKGTDLASFATSACAATWPRWLRGIQTPTAPRVRQGATLSRACVCPRRVQEVKALHEFIATHRDELIARTRAKVALRAAPRPTTYELTNGVPLFLTQLGEILEGESQQGSQDGDAMGLSATRHGGDLLEQGFSIAQVVHDYGDVCQAVTELALELQVPISTDDFHTLNRCLDNAIASAVTEYAHLREVTMSGADVRRRGFFAHELRNHLNTATLAFQVVQSGRVGVTGSTVGVLERSLRGLRELVDRSVTEVRLDSGAHHRERLRVANFIEEMEIEGSVHASSRGLQFTVGPVDHELRVDVDRHLFGSAVSNLLQNAFKFTRPSGHVWLRTQSTQYSVSIEVEDECGGLLPGTAEAIFQPFEQRRANRTGLGLGLTISRQAIEADGGRLSVRDLPGKGCVFLVEMPLAGAALGG